MKIKYWFFLCVLLLMFNNCAPVKDDGTDSLSETLDACLIHYQNAFENTYYAFARATGTCFSCHGGGLGPQFAIDNVSTAFTNFWIQGSGADNQARVLSAKQLFYNNATIQPGHQSVGQTAHIATLTPYEPDWTTATSLYNACVLD